MPEPGAAQAPPPFGSASPPTTEVLPTSLPEPCLAHGTLRPPVLAPNVPYWFEPSLRAIVSAPGNGKSFASLSRSGAAPAAPGATATTTAASAAAHNGRINRFTAVPP